MIGSVLTSFDYWNLRMMNYQVSTNVGVWLHGGCRGRGTQGKGECSESTEGPGWLGKGWKLFGSQGEVKESGIEKLVSLGMGHFTEAQGRGFGREVALGMKKPRLVLQ